MEDEPLANSLLGNHGAPWRAYAPVLADNTQGPSCLWLNRKAPPQERQAALWAGHRCDRQALPDPNGEPSPGSLSCASPSLCSPERKGRAKAPGSGASLIELECSCQGTFLSGVAKQAVNSAARGKGHMRCVIRDPDVSAMATSISPSVVRAGHVKRGLLFAQHIQLH